MVYNDGDMIINSKYRNDIGLTDKILDDIDKYYKYSCSKHGIIDVKYKNDAHLSIHNIIIE